MSMFSDIFCDKYDKKVLGKCRSRQSTCKEDLVLDNGHLLVQVLKRSDILVNRMVHTETGMTLQSKCCWNLQKVDILFSVSRLHCPEGFSRAKDVENCQYISLQIIQQTIENIFRTIISVNQLSLYEAFANICEEFEDHQNRSGELDV